MPNLAKLLCKIGLKHGWSLFGLLEKALSSADFSGNFVRLFCKWHMHSSQWAGYKIAHGKP